MKTNNVIPLRPMPSASRRSCARRNRSRRAALSQTVAAILDGLCYLTLLTCLIVAAGVLVAMV